MLKHHHLAILSSGAARPQDADDLGIWVGEAGIWVGGAGVGGVCVGGVVIRMISAPGGFHAHWRD